MLLFSAMLDVVSDITKEMFLSAVVEWNATNTRKENIIPDVKWTGEMNAKYGNDDLWMEFREYGDIIAVRYEKVQEASIIWDTDYVFHSSEHKLSIRLDRSYTEDADIRDTSFSTPHFITILINKGYLRPDMKLPLTREPVIVTSRNALMFKKLCDGTSKHCLPVVYVSKTEKGENPLDTAWLAVRLKGIAHVFVNDDPATDRVFRHFTDNRIETGGNVGIYYPNKKLGHKTYKYKKSEGYDEELLEKVTRKVMTYSNTRKVEMIYTWQGVNNAILSDHLEKQRKARIDAEVARDKAEREKDDFIESFDEDQIDLENQITNLTNVNTALTLEIEGIRKKMSRLGSTPIVYMGNEDDIYPGEIKDIVIETLNDAVEKSAEGTRRHDVLKDIVDSNEYMHLSEKNREKVKKLFRGYTRMSSALRQELEAMGFVITEDGKHYKITFGADRRYIVVIAKTGSDARGGQNDAMTICRMML